VHELGQPRVQQPHAFQRHRGLGTRLGRGDQTGRETRPDDVVERPEPQVHVREEKPRRGHRRQFHRGGLAEAAAQRDGRVYVLGHPHGHVGDFQADPKSDQNGDERTETFLGRRPPSDRDGHRERREHTIELHGVVDQPEHRKQTVEASPNPYLFAVVPHLIVHFADILAVIKHDQNCSKSNFCK